MSQTSAKGNVIYFAAGGDLTGSSTSQNVINIHGASVPIAGSLTAGNTLQVSGSSSLTYAALNLAGGSNYVTGVLPTANQAAQSLGGDLSGTTAAGTVIKLQGNSVSTQTLNSSTDGYALTWSNADGYWVGSPRVKLSRQIISGTGLSGGGDLSVDRTLSVNYGTSSTTACIGNDSRLSDSRAPNGSASGDLSGTYPSPTVVKLQGNPIQAATYGAAQDGYALYWNNTAGQLQMSIPLSGPPSGAAGGDLTGTYPNPLVAAISGSSPINITPASLNWISTAVSPTITQSLTSVTGTATPLTIIAQKSTGSGSSYGGDLILNSGDGTVQGGNVRITAGSTNTAIPTSSPSGPNGNGSVYIVAGHGNPAGNIYLVGSYAQTNNTSSGSIYITTQNTNVSTGSYPGDLNISLGSGPIGTGTLIFKIGGTTYYRGDFLKHWYSTAGFRFDNIKSKSANYTVGDTDYIIVCNSSGGAFAITLKASPIVGDCYIIKDSGGAALINNITIAGNGKNIDGAATYVINTNYGAVTIIYNGTQWSALNKSL